MHIPTSFLSIPVAAGSAGLALAAVTVAAVRCRKALDERMVPVVGVLGAFVFAAQMINFPVAAGTSGHLAGGFLLGVLCGWAPALVTMAAILVVQGLVFADGGLDALGANIINMGVLPCLMGGLAHQVWRRRGLRWAWPLTALGAWLAVVLAAALVVVEVWLSGRLDSRDLLLAWGGSMIGVHALVGIVEGLISATVLAFLARSELALQVSKEGAA